MADNANCQRTFLYPGPRQRPKQHLPSTDSRICGHTFNPHHPLHWLFLITTLSLFLGCGPSTETVSNSSQPNPLQQSPANCSSDADSLRQALDGYMRPTLTYENLGSGLNNIITRNVQHQHQETQGDANGKESTPTPDPTIVVDIFTSEDTGQSIAFLTDNGIAPRHTGDTNITAAVPISLLADLSQQPGVIRVREAPRPSHR